MTSAFHRTDVHARLEGLIRGHDVEGAPDPHRLLTCPRSPQ